MNTTSLLFRAVLLVVWASSFGAACGPAHISGYEPKRRELEKLAPAPATDASVGSDSLFRANELGGSLFLDARAFRVDDVVLVRVEEVADAQRSADTDVSRTSRLALALSVLPILGPFFSPTVPAGISAEGSANASGESGFSGGGSTNRRERLVATVATVVRDVLPNGNLFVEGHRVVLVNNEEQHLYVSGIVRTIDVDQDNSVASSRIAEAEIEFVGRGVVSDNQNQGVVSRFVNFIWPF